MLDYIVVVDDAVSWHKQNLTLNRHHYSFLKHGGAKFLSEIQHGFGAAVYFNSLVPFEDRVCKTGSCAEKLLAANSTCIIIIKIIMKVANSHCI